MYGYAITVPSAFVALLNTVDPLARLMRQLDDKDLDEESKLTGSWPVGFADAEVVDDIGEGHHEPLRLLEFDVLTRLRPAERLGYRRHARGGARRDAGGARVARHARLRLPRSARRAAGPARSPGVRVRVGGAAGGPRSSPTGRSWSGRRRRLPSTRCTTTVRPRSGTPGCRSSKQILASFELIERRPEAEPGRRRNHPPDAGARASWNGRRTTRLRHGRGDVHWGDSYPRRHRMTQDRTPRRRSLRRTSSRTSTRASASASPCRSASRSSRTPSTRWRA